MSEATNNTDYTIASQQTLIGVLKALGARPFEELALDDLATRVGASRGSCYRALKNLELARWVEQVPSGGWRVTPELTFWSHRVELALRDMHHAYLGRDA